MNKYSQTILIEALRSYGLYCTDEAANLIEEQTEQIEALLVGRSLEAPITYINLDGYRTRAEFISPTEFANLSAAQAQYYKPLYAHPAPLDKENREPECKNASGGQKQPLGETI